jgi:hypothetical protein
MLRRRGRLGYHRVVVASSRLIAVLAALALLAPGAIADESPPSLAEILGAELFQTYERGLRYYEIQQYDRAIESVQLGYEHSRHPEFVFAMAKAQQRSGRCSHAIVALEAFVRADPGPAWVQRARREIATCRRLLDAEASAVLRFDAARAAFVGAQERRARRRRWAVTAGGTGLAMTAAAAVASYLRTRALDDLSGARDDAAYRAALGEAQAWRSVSIALAAAGVGVILGGGLMWTTAPGSPPRPLRERYFVTADVTASHAGVALGGAW